MLLKITVYYCSTELFLVLMLVKKNESRKREFSRGEVESCTKLLQMHLVPLALVPTLHILIIMHCPIVSGVLSHHRLLLP